MKDRSTMGESPHAEPRKRDGPWRREVDSSAGTLHALPSSTHRGFHEEAHHFGGTGRCGLGRAGIVDGAVASRGRRASPGAPSSGPSPLLPPSRGASPPVSPSAAASSLPGASSSSPPLSGG